jgi:hypothetical protein
MLKAKTTTGLVCEDHLPVDICGSPLQIGYTVACTVGGRQLKLGVVTALKTAPARRGSREFKAVKVRILRDAQRHPKYHRMYEEWLWDGRSCIILDGDDQNKARYFQKLADERAEYVREIGR